MLAPPTDSHLQIIQAVGDPDASVQQSIQLMRDVPGLGERILACVNSPFFGVGREVKETNRAALLLGSDGVAWMAVLHAMIDAEPHIPLGEQERAELWEDCVRRGTIAQKLAERYQGLAQDLAFITGFALEFGRASIVADKPELALFMGDVRRMPRQDRLDREEELFGISHDKAFVQLAEIWGLPRKLVQIVGAHHRCERIEDREIAAYVHLAALADLCAEPFTADEPMVVLQHAAEIASAQLRWDKNSFLGFLKGVPGLVERMARLLELRIPEQEPLASVMRRGNSCMDPREMNHEELIEEIHGLRGMKQRQQQQIEELRAQVALLTNRDRLTELPTRVRYLEQLEREGGRARRGDNPLAVLVLDLDRFTDLNARYGQDAGDAVLRKVAKILRRVIREQDFLARTGGDEFSVILPNTSQSGGRVLAERIRAAVEGMKIDHDDRRILLSGSVIGSSLSDLAEDASWEAFHAHATKGAFSFRGRSGNRASWAA